jgi:hypothetical protein
MHNISIVKLRKSKYAGYILIGDSNVRVYELNCRQNYTFQLLSNFFGRSQDSPVGVEKMLSSGRSGDQKAVRKTDSSCLLNVQTGCGAHTASYLMGSFLSIRRPKREADHSPPSIAKVKNTWSYISTPSIHLQVVYWNNCKK